MKEIPILFSTSMVRAIMDGRKTQTRRIIKQDLSVHMVADCQGIISFFQGAWGCTQCGAFHWDNSLKCRFGNRGDRLWVRETWAYSGYWEAYEAAGIGPFNHELPVYQYKADQSLESKGWKPSIHMPKSACRNFLEVESIHPERLQDISENDSIAEGVDKMTFLNGEHVGWRNYTPTARRSKTLPHLNKQYAKQSYETLWESINGPDSWNQNPWVWVIKFKRVIK